MNDRILYVGWHVKLVGICENKLQRKLSKVELDFIQSSKGFIALEMIEDAVNELSDIALKSYLNSEIQKYEF